MGWGTSYKYDGYLNRILKREVEEKIEETKENIQERWEEILAFMAAQPPADTEDEEGGKIDYPEYITCRWRNFKQEMEEDYYLLNHLRDCKEAMEESPDTVEED